jgi:hypothetical protein
MEGDMSTNKQDCEQKAFHRLAKRLKEYFPKLKIRLLLDGLYPNGPVFEACRDYHFGFIIVLKDDQLKQVWDEYNEPQINEKEIQSSQNWGDRMQRFRWVNKIILLSPKMIVSFEEFS